MKSAKDFIMGLGCVAVLVALAGGGFALAAGHSISLEFFLCGGAGLSVILLGLLTDRSESKTP